MGTYNPEHKGEEKKVCVCCKKEKWLLSFIDLQIGDANPIA